MSRGIGTIQEKVLLLLLGGFALALSRSPGKQFRITKEIGREWREINRRALRRAIAALYQSHLVNVRDHKDGSTTITLSRAGKIRALTFKLNEMQISIPSFWDKKWRIVIFDIPEKKKKLRNAFRFHLKQIGFHELQKSVFVHAYPCQQEVEYLTEWFSLKSHVRWIIAEEVDNALHLKRKFGIQ